MERNRARRSLVLVLCLVFIQPDDATAEIRTITATGEYRMGDNDTRADAKRLALLDAKRLALEQAGTYIESITEVKNLNVSNDEIRAYTAGIVAVTELATQTTMEGSTTVVRVQVSAAIDPDVVAKQIDVLRQNEMTKTRLLQAELEAKQLRTALEAKTRELGAQTTKPNIDKVAKQRDNLIKDMLKHDLLKRAMAILAASVVSTGQTGQTTATERTIVRGLLQQVFAIDPSDLDAHMVLGNLLEEEHRYQEAILEYQTVLAARPDYDYGDGTDVDVHRVEIERDITRIRNMSTRRRLGMLLTKTHDHHNAIEQLSLVLIEDPNDAMVHFYLGWALSSANEPVGAIREIRAALLLGLKEPMGHLFLAVQLKKAGETEEAIKELREFLRLEPDTLRYRRGIQLARALLRQLERGLPDNDRSGRQESDLDRFILGSGVPTEGQGNPAAK